MTRIMLIVVLANAPVATVFAQLAPTQVVSSREFRRARSIGIAPDGAIFLGYSDGAVAKLNSTRKSIAWRKQISDRRITCIMFAKAPANRPFVIDGQSVRSIEPGRNTATLELQADLLVHSPGIPVIHAVQGDRLTKSLQIGRKPMPTEHRLDGGIPICASRSADMVVTKKRNGEISLLHKRGNKPSLKTTPRGEGIDGVSVESAAFYGEGNLLVAVSNTGVGSSSIVSSNLRNLSVNYEIALPAGPVRFYINERFGWVISTVASRADIWKLKDGSHVSSLLTHNRVVRDISLRADGSELCMLLDPGYVTVLNTARLAKKVKHKPK